MDRPRPAHEIRVPELGIPESRLSVGMWLVPRGGRVRETEPIVEILAGEAVVDLDAPATGVLNQVLVGEDQPVRVGQLLGVVRADW